MNSLLEKIKFVIKLAISVVVNLFTLMSIYVIPSMEGNVFTNIIYEILFIIIPCVAMNYFFWIRRRRKPIEKKDLNVTNNNDLPHDIPAEKDNTKEDNTQTVYSVDNKPFGYDSGTYVENDTHASHEAPKLEIIPSEYLVFDVETPNKANNTICQIGLLHIIEGVVVKNYSEIIDPEDKFDRINTEIHNISKLDVRGCPNFKSFWTNEIEELFRTIPIVGHNVEFDLSVLCKDLIRYNLSVPSEFLYIDTLGIFKEIHPEFDSFSLGEICKKYGVDISKAHNAEYDVRMTNEILVCASNELMVPARMDTYTPREDLDTKVSQIKDTIEHTVDIQYDETDILLDKNYVFSGDFALKKRSELEEIVSNHGGTIKKSITKNVDYLVVGSVASDSWKYGNYGNKINTALEKREQFNLKIISEAAMVHYLEKSKDAIY